MILTERVKIRLNNRNINYYKEKHETNLYKLNDIIDVDIEDISNGSHVKIIIKCDKCEEEKEMEYRIYLRHTKNQTQDYYCNACAMIRRKATSNEKYGVDHPMQNKEIYNKFRKTNLEKYGVEYPIKLDFFKNKQQQTNLEKYGVKYVSLSDDVRKKQILTKAKKTAQKFEQKFIDYDFDKNEIELECVKNHTYKEKINFLYHRKCYDVELCTICNKKGVSYSNKENQLLDFIRENYDGKIITSDRKILKPNELDIYLPELNLAFEFNGIYWHNELYKDTNYHLLKTEKCIEKNIQLIHIWEDDWNLKQEIVKSMILNKFKKSKNKIYGRKTEIKEVADNKMIKAFLIKNHLQGFVERIVMRSKSKNDNEFELLRFCNKLNTNVLGSASKLFKYFIKNYDVNEIITYADRSHSKGNLYDTLGFEFNQKTQPNYFYVIDKQRKHRFNYRKNILVEQGYDKNMTEHEIMLSRNVYRIYDSGSLKFNYCVYCNIYQL